MCGRYALFDLPRLPKRFHLDSVPISVGPRYNVTPGQEMVVVTRNSPNKAVTMRWGLVPFWAKDPNIGYKMINARAETLSLKPAFKRSLLSQRCLVPTSGFYEWKKTAAGKQPYYIKLKNKDIFAFAGLYDTWNDAEGKQLSTYTIITTAPNELMSEIHNRMPAILNETDEDTWLDLNNHDPGVLQSLLKPYAYGEMTAFPVSKAVNNPDNDGEQLISPQSANSPTLF